MWPQPLQDKAERLLALCRAHECTIVTAESCTGGMVAALLTAISGASDVVECGFVTYSNRSKEQLLGVPAAVIATQGAVSKEVAEAMARGALVHSSASLAIAITGIAGPGGGSATKPVGLVYVAVALQGNKAVTIKSTKNHWHGSRDTVRLQATEHALEMAIETVQGL